MFCPECGAEYRDGFYECSDCRVSLVNELPPRSFPKPQPTRGLVTVLATSDPLLMGAVKPLLEEAGIPCVVKGKGLQDLFAVGRMGTGFNPIVGPIELQVELENEENARALIADFDRSQSSSDSESRSEFPIAEEIDTLGPSDSSDEERDKKPLTPHRRQMIAFAVIMVIVLSGLGIWGMAEWKKARWKEAYNEGTSRELAGRNQEAIPYFEKAISLKPDDAKSYINRGIAYDELGQHQRAISDETLSVEVTSTAGPKD